MSTTGADALDRRRAGQWLAGLIAGGLGAVIGWDDIAGRRAPGAARLPARG